MNSVKIKIGGSRIYGEWLRLTGKKGSTPNGEITKSNNKRERKKNKNFCLFCCLAHAEQWTVSEIQI